MERSRIELIAQRFSNLYGRWQDEKEYEDFTEYVKAVRQWLAAENYSFVKMTKRPFAVTFKDHAGALRVLKAHSRGVDLISYK